MSRTSRARLDGAPGPVIAVSDYMRAVQDQIALRGYAIPGVRWAPTASASPTPRAAARRYFLVDAESIVVATLESLAGDGLYDASAAADAFDRYRLGDPTAVAGVAQEGAQEPCRSGQTSPRCRKVVRGPRRRGLEAARFHILDGLRVAGDLPAGLTDDEFVGDSTGADHQCRAWVPVPRD